MRDLINKSSFGTSDNRTIFPNLFIFAAEGESYRSVSMDS